MLDVAFQPDRLGPEPIYVQLAGYLRGLIAAGRLRPGEKVPATRELASGLGIGRNTAAQAYQLLVDDGALLAHVGQGTFVSSRAASMSRQPDLHDQPRAFVWDGLFSRASRHPLPKGVASVPRSEVQFDFRGGRIDPSVLPLVELRRAYSKAVSRSLVEIANINDLFGHPPLREEISRSLVTRGIECEPDDVLVTAGAQQAIDLVARVLIDPGDCVAIENPGYTIASLAFRSAGARLIGIDVDDEGLRTDQLARALRSHRLKLIFTTPAAQQPTGVVLGDARRRALLDLADETQTPILEDDYDSEFRSTEAPPPALKTLDRAGQVIYVGTFSKAIFPGLRLGYAVAPPALRDRLAIARFQSTVGADAVSQAAITDLLASGAYPRHVRRLRRHYAERRVSLQSALHREMPKGTHWNQPKGGLQIWLTLPPGVRGDVLRKTARAEGIAYSPGEFFYLDAGGENQLALSFGNQSPEAISLGITKLGKMIRALCPKPPLRMRNKGTRK